MVVARARVFLNFEERKFFPKNKTKREKKKGENRERERPQTFFRVAYTVYTYIILLKER